MGDSTLIGKSTTKFEATEAFALAMDASDPLAFMREKFCIPAVGDVVPRGVQPSGNEKQPCVYLVGNSLGLQPKATRSAMEQELEDWARLGVEAHFHGAHPWFPAHEEVRENLAMVVGAAPNEVVAMNTLTTNLHLLMVSFYRPTRERYKIVIEDTAFPSDSYAVRSQAEFHARGIGFDPANAIIRLRARPGESTLRTEDILEVIDREAGSIALVMLGGVNYLTGQFFNMQAITEHAHKRGIVVGWDLAHAAGNIDLKLHDWAPDFACWCSYKYLNSGPGSIAGLFVHERHLRDRSLPRFAGWWGNDPSERFKMKPDFVPAASADAWQLSNPPIFALTPLRASLGLYAEAGMERLRAKSKLLTGYLEWLIDGVNSRRGENARIQSLTPRDPAQRGCQLSLLLPGDARGAFSRLQSAGIVCDFREPNVIRAAPVPLYNSFHDVWRCVRALEAVV